MRPFAVLALAIMSASAADTGNTGKSWLLVANKGEHTLGIVDPASGKQVAAVDEGGVTGHEVIASPDGRTAYVPIYGDSGVGKPGTDGTHLVANLDLAGRKIAVRSILDGRPSGLPHVRAEEWDAPRSDQAG